MKKDILKEIKIPEGIEVKVDHETVIARAGEKEIKKRFNLTNINLELKDNKIIIESKNATKREGTKIGTIEAHLNNILKGLEEGFEYKLKIEYVHFPINVDFSGKELKVKNFLGEKKPRICKVIDGAEIEINGSDIVVKSFNKEIAGQMAANLEKCTVIKGKDKRKFQDGIYIVEKCGRAM
jgi:large subunit ribosomal protein L6